MNRQSLAYNAQKQVNPQQYLDVNKLSLINFINCYQQIDDIRKIGITNPKILIVGVGDNILLSILKKFYTSIDTLDILDELNPTYVGSIHQLSKLTSRKYDIVIVSHVLEHLPFDLFETCLKEIKKHSQYSLIYLPRAGITLQFHAKIIPLTENHINIFVPAFKYKKYRFNGQHYWEIDTKGHPLTTIHHLISKHFKILCHYHNPRWAYSYNFILKSSKT